MIPGGEALCTRPEGLLQGEALQGEGKKEAEPDPSLERRVMSLY